LKRKFGVWGRKYHENTNRGEGNSCCAEETPVLGRNSDAHYAVLGLDPRGQMDSYPLKG
jgi:hypothetical protein